MVTSRERWWTKAPPPLEEAGKASESSQHLLNPRAAGQGRQHQATRGRRRRSAMATRGRQHESGMSGQHSALRTCNLQCGRSATNGEHTMKRQQRRRRVDPCATESRTPLPRGRDATTDRRMRGPRGRRIASWRRIQRGCSLQRGKYVGSGTVDDADGKWQLNK